VAETVFSLSIVADSGIDKDVWMFTPQHVCEEATIAVDTSSLPDIAVEVIHQLY